MKLYIKKKTHEGKNCLLFFICKSHSNQWQTTSGELTQMTKLVQQTLRPQQVDGVNGSHMTGFFIHF